MYYDVSLEGGKRRGKKKDGWWRVESTGEESFQGSKVSNGTDIIAPTLGLFVSLRSPRVCATTRCEVAPLFSPGLQKRFKVLERGWQELFSKVARRCGDDA